MAKIDIGKGGDDGTSINIPTVSASDATLESILNTVYMWGGIVAVIVIVIAGFLYVTANGDAQHIQRAKNALMGAVIGLIIIFFAFLITQLVIQIGQSA